MATSFAQMHCVVDLPRGWVNSQMFEAALLRCGDALGNAYTQIIIRISDGCRLMIDVVIRLLSFCNQIIATSRRLKLEFSASSDVMGYLSRMGFFDHLAREVEVTPNRPLFSGAWTHRGKNNGLVEIERFNRAVEPDQDLPDRLAAAVKNGCANRSDASAASSAVSNIFSELIRNVIDHSQDNLDAFAALQTYPQGNIVNVAVSDSGIGIMGSLRPALVRKGSPDADLNDLDLLLEILRKGVSSLDDPNRGIGLMASAKSAVRYRADLDVRLPRQRILLRPANGAYGPSTAYCQDDLALLWGTHISFALKMH